MENLKIKVSSEAESKEVQELFVALGYMVVNNIDCEKGYIVASKNAESPINFDYWHDVKNIITIQQLRDLVVLKRNSNDDATHENSFYCYIELSDGWYYFDMEVRKWLKSISGKPEYYGKLKPIEKPMREPKQAEFLVKTDGGYVLQVLDKNAGGADVVRIPDGAEIAILASGVVYFWKSHFFNGGVHKDWVDMKGGWDASWYLKSVPSAITIWKRETLNDQVASAEQYREMISNAAGIGLTSVVADIAQSCSGGASRNASSQGQSQFPLNNYELNHRVAKAFNAVRGTNLNEDDVNYIRELIDLTIFHYGERK